MRNTLRNMIQRNEITWTNIKSYIQGKFRYELFYRKHLKNLIRLHIFEQITYRIFVMDKECLQKGECKLCGCETTALQMADKACNKPCYPKMMNKEVWRVFKILKGIYFIYKGKSYNRDNFELRIEQTFRK